MAICVVALLTEATLGYSDGLYRRVGHPVTWMGRLLTTLDRRLNRDSSLFALRRAAGFLALALLLAVTGGAAGVVTVVADGALPASAAVCLLGLMASSCLAQRSLYAHVRAVAEALESDGLDAGRRAVAMIVGRDTANLDTAGVCRAAIESLAENFADGVVAPTFWLAVGGLSGGILYKAVNTADSMIGHRTPRHEAFGFAAAKLDDLANWPAARLAALWIAAAAALAPQLSAKAAWRVMRRDARGHPSPNAGWPEAAMAGALAIRLGGPRSYRGRTIVDPPMGDGTAEVTSSTIRRALRLYSAACALNVAAIGALAVAAAISWR